MSNELSTVDINSSLNMWDDRAKIEEIRKLFAPKLTEMEFQFFVGLGKVSGLNPFTREIWAVKYDEKYPAQVFIGRDGYRKAAQAHSEYDYHQCDAVYENDKFEVINGEVKHAYKLTNRGALIGAYCIAKRHKSSRPIYVFAELKEYSTGKSLWSEEPGKGKPATMIKKVAESQCLRACFQDLLGGTYGEEEMARHKEEPISTVQGANQTEKLKNILNNNVIDAETGEVLEPKKVYNTGRDDLPINDEQIDLIQSIMSEKNFSEERVKKALASQKVEALEQLSDAQARVLLLQLERA